MAPFLENAALLSVEHLTCIDMLPFLGELYQLNVIYASLPIASRGHEAYSAVGVMGYSSY